MSGDQSEALPTCVAKEPDFAPDDPTDGRELLDWESKYPANARRSIRIEASYLVVLLIGAPVMMCLLWTDCLQIYLPSRANHIYSIKKYSLAWLSGMFGGSLFTIKWLYHCVARKMWHMDRRLWRLFTPLISGALAFAVIMLMSSGLLSVFDGRSVRSGSTIASIGFLVGYFSDTAIAKLREIAETIFGAQKKKQHSNSNIPGSDEPSK